MRTLITMFLLLAIKLQLTAQFSDPAYIVPHLDGLSQILAEDLNQDSHPDLLGVAADNNRLYWTPYLPEEETFADPRIINLGNYQPCVVWSTDVSSDGLADIVIVDKVSGALLWVANQSAGENFSEPQIIDNQWNQISHLEEVDLNGDERSDLLIVDTEEGTVAWYANPGDGNWGDAEVILDGLGTITTMHIADLNSDGLLDLILAQDDGEIYWYRRTGAGVQFDAPALVADFPFSISSLGAANLDNDDNMDLVASSYIAGRVYLINQVDATGTFASPEQIGDPLDANHLQLIDMDNDGDIDIFLTGQELGQNVYYRNDDGVFDERTINYYDHYPNNLLCEDFNLDGFLDIVTIGEVINSLFYFANRANGFFQFDFSRVFQYGTGRPEVIRTADMNNDGSLDLVAIHSATTLLIQDNVNGYGQLAPAERASNCSGLIRGLQIDDLDQNGLLDVVFADYNHVYFAKQIGPDEFAERELLDPFSGSGDDPTALQLIDLDHDDYPEIVYGSSGALYIIGNDGNGNFFEPVALDYVNNGRAVLYLADLDQDGDPDIVASYGAAFAGGIYWYENLDGNGTFSDRILIDAESKATVVPPVDIDQDGNLDVLTVHNEILVYKNTGDGQFTAPEQLIDDADGIITGDIDNDGWVDIVFRDQSRLYLSLNQGGTFPEHWQFGPQDVFYGAMHLVDIDDDSDLDLYCSGDNYLAWFENRLVDNNPELSVRVFWDENENANFDTDEYTLSGQTADLLPDGISSWTNADGLVLQRIFPGEYQLTLRDNPNWQATTDISYNITATEDVPALQREFGLIPATDALMGRVDITSAPTRCGFTVPFWLSVVNEGTVISSGLAGLTIDPNCEFISASPAPDSIADNRYYWRFSELIPTQEQQVYLEIQMPGVESLGETVVFTGSLEQESVVENLTDVTTEHYRPVINCAYDPNDKQVVPNNLGNTEYTLFGDTLIYTIRFQNTGTDTAFTVRLEDRLDNQLDWSTFTLIASSHDMQLAINRVGLATFLFENILLPDSTTNEPASHGFIKFSILPQTGLPVETLITNSAQIFFDFNPPIVTNTTRSLLVSEYPFRAFRQDANCFDSFDGSLEIIFPVDSLTYTWSTGAEGVKIENLDEGTYSVTATDHAGNTINTGSFNVYAPNPLLVEEIDVLDNSCFGQTNGAYEFTIDGGVGPYQVLLNGLPQELPLDDLPAGDYHLMVIDVKDCMLEEDFTIDSPPALIISPSIVDEVDGGQNGSISTEVTGGTPPYSYAWSNGATQESIENLSAGEYTLSITDALDCITTITYTVDMVVQTKDPSRELSFRVFPNPTQGVVNMQVQLKDIAPWKLDIIDARGRVLSTYDVSDSSEGLIQLAPQTLAGGIYFIKLRTAQYQLERKLIIIR